MNDQQKQAIDGCMVELCESVKPTIFLPYLRMWNLLDRHECQLINGSLRTDAEKILETFDLIRSKAGSWEVLVKFLRDNKFVDLANKLLNSAGQGMEEDELEELVGQLLDLYVQNNMPASSQPPLIQTAPSTYPIETEDVFHLSAEQVSQSSSNFPKLMSLKFN